MQIIAEDFSDCKFAPGTLVQSTEEHLNTRQAPIYGIVLYSIGAQVIVELDRQDLKKTTVHHDWLEAVPIKTMRCV